MFRILMLVLAFTGACKTTVSTVDGGSVRRDSAVREDSSILSDGSTDAALLADSASLGCRVS